MPAKPTEARLERKKDQARLLAWYHALLKKSLRDGVVVRISNLADTFLEGGHPICFELSSAEFVPYFNGAHL